MKLVSVAAPQNLQYHQKEERERRKAGDIYKRCGTAKPTIPSEGRERERRKAGDIYKRCGTAKPIIPSEGREREERERELRETYKTIRRKREREREGEREEFLLIKMSRFVS